MFYQDMPIRGAQAKEHCRALEILESNIVEEDNKEIHLA
ncbi:hypothetical protein ASZ90_012247 [hydrocarbon metagenome]|uniref:Uncharacterized protein n=1 Tax=hydrocarbon metagenome TaxID=938273 RepID=A0A0W8FBA9_9ZZZZ